MLEDYSYSSYISYDRISRQQDGKGKRLEVSHEKETLQLIEKLKLRYRTNRHCILLSVFFILLYKLSNEERLYIGCLADTRMVSEFKQTMGYFLNTIPYMLQLDNSFSLGKSIQTTFQSYLNTLKHSSLPYNLILKDLDISNGRDGLPFMSIVMTEVPYNPLFHLSYTENEQEVIFQKVNKILSSLEKIVYLIFVFLTSLDLQNYTLLFLNTLLVSLTKIQSDLSVEDLQLY